MLMAAVVVLSVLTVPLAGGSLRALAELRLRHTWAILTALFIQVAITTFLSGGPKPLFQVAHVVSYVLGGLFLVSNRRLPGIWLITLGAALNVLAILANGGVMPGDAGALRMAGKPVSSGDFENSAVLAHPRLGFLGDIFAVPSAVPLANVFSVGDVLIVAGGIWALHRVCASRLTGRVRQTT